jgi:hypothetical protein
MLAIKDDEPVDIDQSDTDVVCKRTQLPTSGVALTV